MDTSDESTEVCGERRCADALHLAFLSRKEVVTEHAQWRDQRMKDEQSAADVSPLEGVDAASSALVAGQELLPQRGT